MFRPWNSPCISHLLAPFRMGIEEGMGVKIQREVPLVIPQPMQRPWMALAYQPWNSKIKKARLWMVAAKAGENSNCSEPPEIYLKLCETCSIRTWQIWVCLRMAHPNPWLDHAFFFMFPLKWPIPHFQTLGALRDTFQCTHDPPKKKDRKRIDRCFSTFNNVLYIFWVAIHTH